MDEAVHTSLSLSQRVSAVFLPKSLLLHLRVRQHPLRPLEFEQAVGQFVKVKVLVFRDTLHLQFLQKIHQLQLHNHVILRHHLLARRQLRKFLNDTHVVHKVHIASFRNTHVHLLHAVSTVVHDVNATRKPKVLRVVRRKVHTDATVRVVHHQRVDDKVAIKANGVSRRDRAAERVLQQSHILLVNVHIRKAILQHTRQNVACVEQFVDTIAPLSRHDALFRFRVFAVNQLRHRFVHRNRQNQFSRFVAHLHMFFQERQPFEFTLLENLVGYFVKGQRHFGVFVNAIVVVLFFQVAFLFGRNHLFHQFHGRVVFARVFFLFTRHHRRRQCTFDSFYFKYERVVGFFHRKVSRFVANHRHAHLSGAEGHTEVSVHVGSGGLAPREYHIGKGNFFARFSICHPALNQGLCQCRGSSGNEHQCEKKKTFNHVVAIRSEVISR